MEYDLIVIGGGPAGIMAAGTAVQKGARVLLLERKDRLGTKLLITGKGRCNLTNAEFNNRKFVEKFGKNGNFLHSSLSKFSAQDTINFFENKGLKTKIERGQRVFPESDKSQDVLRVLKKYLENVEIKTGTKVKSIAYNKNRIKNIVLENNQTLEAENYVICTGGKSYPSTGSTGNAFSWLKNKHRIVPPKPALVSVILKENWIKDLEGLSLKNVAINVYQKQKKIDSRFGEAIFTANGLSGPIILDLSKKIGEYLEKDKVEIQIDYKPALNFEKLDKRLQRDFKEFHNKMFKNSLDDLLPKKLIPIIVRLSKINSEKKVNLITKEERKELVHLLKEFKLQVKSLDGFNKAIITSGGIDLKEIDSKTMQSKIIENLYLAGEVLDLDGPTGGYNLQVCWTTGFVAGSNV